MSRSPWRRLVATAIGASALVVPVVSPAGPASASTHRAGATLFPLPAPAVQPEPCPPPYHPPPPPPPPLPAPKVREAAVPIAAPPSPRHVVLGAIYGKGLWVTPWPGKPPNVPQLLAMAKGAGVHQLWIRTGSSYNGYYGAQTLAALVPAAQHEGIAVIAWDFPTLSDPAADAARAAVTMRSGVNGFSADIEGNPEGTYLTARRVAYYLSLVRRDAGNLPVIATVPRPLSLSLANYPYAAEAPYVDAFAPMVYWDCNEPGAATLTAIQALRVLRPVAPIGQDYNMGPDGGRVGLPSGPEIWRFLDVARRDGALGASLYDVESGGPTDLATLAAYPW